MDAPGYRKPTHEYGQVFGDNQADQGAEAVLLKHEDTRKCHECGGEAEQEQDGDCRYWACTTCGTEFGYERVSQPSADSCQLGVPESVRRRATPVAPPAAPVFIGTIGRRPSSG